MHGYKSGRRTGSFALYGLIKESGQRPPYVPQAVRASPLRATPLQHFLVASDSLTWRRNAFCVEFVLRIDIAIDSDDPTRHRHRLSWVPAVSNGRMYDERLQSTRDKITRRGMSHGFAGLVAHFALAPPLAGCWLIDAGRHEDWRCISHRRWTVQRPKNRRV